MQKNSSKTILLLTLAGVQNVRMDGDLVVGEWQAEGVYLGNKTKSRHIRTLVEQFANWKDSPRAILGFVKRYGPLTKRPESGDSAFCQSVADWRDFQSFIRRRWSFGKSLGFKIGMRAGETIHFDRYGRVSTLVVENLQRFMEFELWTHACAHWLKCACPDCKNPYIIAVRSDQEICDDPQCVEWTQRKYKRQWWEAHGNEWRKKRAVKKKKANRPPANR
jgi:hypothetical protein